MENLEKPAENIENAVEQKNEWEEMAAEAPDFNKEAAINEVREQIIDQFENGKGIAGFEGLQKFLDTGDIKGYENKIDKAITFYQKESILLKNTGKINQRQLEKIKTTADAYDRYIRKTLEGKNPEEPTKEQPKFKERISALTDTNASNSIKVLDYKRDQEEISVLKSLSPEAKKSLDSLVGYLEKQQHSYEPLYSSGPLKQAPENGDNNNNKTANLPDQGPNANSPLFNEYPYNPFQ